jgi:hypothetical protein
MKLNHATAGGNAALAESKTQCDFAIVRCHLHHSYDCHPEGDTMKQSQFKSAYILSGIIAILALVQSLAGLLVNGVYRDNAWVTATWYGNDLITLVVALPVFVLALIYSVRGSMRAHLVWLAMLVYMLYNYSFYLLGAALNHLFLVYAALFSLSIQALVFSLPRVDALAFMRLFDAKTPRRFIGGFLLAFSFLVAGMWISQSVIFSLSGQIPQIVVDSKHVTNLVAAIDLSSQVPFLFLSGIWIWQKRPWGYVLAAIMSIADCVYMLVLLAFSPFAAKANVPGAWDFAPNWGILFLGCLVCCVLLYKNSVPFKSESASG